MRESEGARDEAAHDLAVKAPVIQVSQCLKGAQAAVLDVDLGGLRVQQVAAWMPGQQRFGASPAER